MSCNSFCFVRLGSFLPLCRSDWSEVDKNQVMGLVLTASSSSSFLARLPCPSSVPPWQKLFDLWLSVMINRRTKFSNVPPDLLHVLPVLADSYRGEVQLSQRLWNRLQGRDRLQGRPSSRWRCSWQRLPPTSEPRSPRTISPLWSGNSSAGTGFLGDFFQDFRVLQHLPWMEEFSA